MCDVLNLFFMFIALFWFKLISTDLILMVSNNCVFASYVLLLIQTLNSAFTINRVRFDFKQTINRY